MTSAEIILSVCLGAALFGAGSACAETGVDPANVVVVGDGIPAALSPVPPDAGRGRAIVLDRANGNCLICHQVPEPGEPFQGDLGPDLAGVGNRLTPAQLRLRLVDQSRLNAATLMPPFYRRDGLVRVAQRFAGQTVLKAGEVEDVIAYLATLKD
jgi:L-cysteine S-thiosulfotransferase